MQATVCTDLSADLPAGCSEQTGVADFAHGSEDSVRKAGAEPRSEIPSGQRVLERGCALWPGAMVSTPRKLENLVLFQTTDTEQIANSLETSPPRFRPGIVEFVTPDPCTEGNVI